MKRWPRILLIVVGILLLIVLVGPFLVPVPPLEGVVPPEQLADPDSRFVEVDGLTIHYKMRGESEPALVLLHGFGASLFSWREVLAPLAQEGRVVAFDRPAFGLTERPMPDEWTGDNPYSREAQAAQTIGLMDALGIRQAVLLGNSAGGTIAVLVALRYPERVRALVLVDAAIYEEGGAPGWARPLLNTPQVRRLGPLLVRSIQSLGEEGIRLAWHDPTRITPEILEGYRKPLRAQNWDRALWEFTRASRPLDLPDRLDEIAVPVLVITGDDDRIVHPELSERLAQDLPNAQLVVIPDCGHLPQEEQPEAFVQAVREFLAEIRE